MPDGLDTSQQVVQRGRGRGFQQRFPRRFPRRRFPGFPRRFPPFIRPFPGPIFFPIPIGFPPNRCFYIDRFGRCCDRFGRCCDRFGRCVYVGGYSNPGDDFDGRGYDSEEDWEMAPFTEDMDADYEDMTDYYETE